MSIDKRIGAFSHIESKKVPIHEKFDETNSKYEKKFLKTQPHSGQKSTKMKTHQRPQIFLHLSKPLIAFFWAPIDRTMSIDKRIGAFSHIESKKVPIHEKFDETNSKYEKKTQPHSGHQKPIYVSPAFGGRKKGHQQPLSQAKKNAPINQVIFH